MRFQRIIDYLFPPIVDGINARLRRLMAGTAPRFSVTPADVEARLERLQPPKPRTAVERLQADVDRAVAAAEEQMHGEWMERR